MVPGSDDGTRRESRFNFAPSARTRRLSNRVFYKS